MKRCWMCQPSSLLPTDISPFPRFAHGGGPLGSSVALGGEVAETVMGHGSASRVPILPTHLRCREVDGLLCQRAG